MGSRHWCLQRAFINSLKAATKALRFTTAAALVNELVEAKDANQLSRALGRWSRYELIAIDELGYVPLAKVGAELLFQVIADRAEKAAVIITTKKCGRAQFRVSKSPLDRQGDTRRNVGRSMSNVPVSGVGLPGSLTKERFADASQLGLPVLTNILLNRGMNRETASEIAQAAWVKAWEHLAELRNPDSLRSWTTAIALNLTRDFLKSENRWEPLEKVSPFFHATMTRLIDTERMLSKCSENERTLLTQHYLHGHSTRDIAEQDGCSELATRLRLHRARKSLRKRLVPQTPLADARRSNRSNQALTERLLTRARSPPQA